MQPTPTLRTRLRKLLNEVIPAKGTEADTNFLDAELDEILEESDSLYAAASAGWLEKAGLLQGDIESYKAGSESYDLTSLKDRLQHAMTMSQRYKQMAEELAEPPSSSFMLHIRPPKVL